MSSNWNIWVKIENIKYSQAVTEAAVVGIRVNERDTEIAWYLIARSLEAWGRVVLQGILGIISGNEIARWFRLSITVQFILFVPSKARSVKEQLVIATAH